MLRIGVLDLKNGGQRPPMPLPHRGEVEQVAWHARRGLDVTLRGSAPSLRLAHSFRSRASPYPPAVGVWITIASPARSEEHTSELQSLRHLVCRLLLEKKKYNM